MKTAEMIKLKKAYLEGLYGGIERYSKTDAEIIKHQIKMLDWVLEDNGAPVNIKREGK